MRRYSFLPLIILLIVFAADAATLSDAKMAIRTRDFSKAVKILEPLSRKGDKEAQYHLAVMYRNGQGTRKDVKKAAFWLKKSAAQGYERAQYSLGVLYEEGIGVNKDLVKAVYWYKAAADQDYRNAAKRLSLLKEGGQDNTLNTADMDTDEALHIAVVADDLVAVKKLLREGADINATDTYERPVLMEAINRKNVEMVRLLLANGADANAVDGYRDIPNPQPG